MDAVDSHAAHRSSLASLERFARHVECSLGRDLVGVIHVNGTPGGDEVLVLTSQTGLDGATHAVRRLPQPEGVGQDRVRVQSFDDFCALMERGDPDSLHAATHGAALADPLSALEEIRQHCRAALDDPTAINIDGLHAFLHHQARQYQARAASHLAAMVDDLRSALLAITRAQHAATDPEGAGATTSLDRVLQLLSIESVRAVIDELVGMDERQTFTDLASDPSTLTADLQAVFAALERYECQVFGCCDGQGHQ